MPRKPPARTELDKLSHLLDEPDGKEKVFFTDIALAFSADVSALHEQFEAVRRKLIFKLGKQAFQKQLDSTTERTEP